jgi:hypothetical protein
MTSRHYFAAIMMAGLITFGAAAAEPVQPEQHQPHPAAADAPAAQAHKPKQAAASDAKAAPPRRRPFESIMFTVDEYTEIQSRIASGGVTAQNEGKQAIEDATLYLSTIVYYGPKDWMIWVNGVPIGPTQDFQAFQVTEIDPNSVELLVPLSAQGMRPVRLSPNQTFITKTGTVVEGRVQ